MRNVLCLVLAALAGCGIENKVAPDGATVDGAATGDGEDGSGSGSSTELTITLTEKPPVLGNSADVTFGLMTNIAATIECRLDSEAYHACSDHQAVAALSDGMHSFDARATAGDQMAAIPTYSFAVDTMPPAMMITGQPPANSPVATAQFYFQKDDSTTVTCQLDSAAATACTSPVMYSGLADGSHTFTVTGTDGAGNTASATYTWMVDTTAPDLTITMEPRNPSTSTTATFQFFKGSAVTVTCQLDAGAPAACTSPKTYTGLADGSHTFTLKDTNSAGITSTQTYTWTIDATPPAVTIDSAPAAMTNATTAQFQFTVTGATTTTCQLDGGTPNTCTTSFSVTGLAQGQHTFTVRGTDAAGNTGSQSYTWSIDTTPPTVSITLGPGSTSNSRSTSIWFDASDATTCRLDSDAPVACSTRADYTGLADGTHTFVVTATDPAGNTASASYTWTIDATAPSIAGLSYSCDINTGALSVSWTASDTHLSGQSCSYPNGTNTLACNNGWSGNLSGPSSVFAVTATDSFGNSATRSITIKTTACQ